MARTIDKLGVDTSIRYAEDRKKFDETLIKEARLIPEQTKVTTTSPSYTSEFDALFGLQEQGALWAAVRPPSKYFSYRRPLFTVQLIPNLGSPDLQEAKLTRLESFKKEATEEVKKEIEVLTTLFKTLHLLNQILIDSNSGRAQYHKG